MVDETGNDPCLRGVPQGSILDCLHIWIILAAVLGLRGLVVVSVGEANYSSREAGPWGRSLLNEHMGTWYYFFLWSNLAGYSITPAPSIGCSCPRSHVVMFSVREANNISWGAGPWGKNHAGWRYVVVSLRINVEQEFFA